MLGLTSLSYAQEYGDYPKIEQELLLRDLAILYQALDEYHTGMYWYSSEDSVELAFQQAGEAITTDLNVLEYHKIIAPLVSLSNEDHTNISLPVEVKEKIRQQALFFPARVTFLGTACYLTQNGSNDNRLVAGMRITAINGEPIERIVAKIGNLFASDGYIESVKYSDLRGFQFAKFYYYYYGNVSSFSLTTENEIIEIEALKLAQIQDNLTNRYRAEANRSLHEESLAFSIIDDSTAYLGLHTFGNDEIRANETNKRLASFLENSFKEIAERNIENLIIDLSQNSGGNEGNENLVYSYLGQNYQKYSSVRAKAQKVILDNGVDKAIRLKTFGFFERFFFNRKRSDGSYARKENVGYGLMAYRKEPEYKFEGELYVLISPITYSAGSELANMLYTNDLGVFVGEETGGGYYGNTSGYSKKLTLPHSKITVYIPSLHFAMNVKESIPFGRGVIPHYEVIPTFEEYINKENAALKFALGLIQKRQ